MSTTSRWAGAIAVVAILTVGAAACSGGGEGARDASVSRSSGGSTAARAPGAGSGADVARATSATMTGTKAGTQAAEDRDVISTGDLTIRTKDAERAAEDAREIADDAGGYLANQDAVLDEDQRVEV